MYEMERPRPAARQLRLRLLSAVAAYWPSTQVLGTTGKPVARYSRLRFPVPRVSPEAGFPGSVSLDGCYFLSSRRRAWQDFPASSGKNFLTHRPIHSSILVILQLTPDLHRISTAGVTGAGSGIRAVTDQ